MIQFLQKLIVWNKKEGKTRIQGEEDLRDKFWINLKRYFSDNLENFT